MSIEILNEDCFLSVAKMESESVDCVITDPPYGETSLAWDRWPARWPALVRRVLKRTGSMWVFGSTRMFFDRSAEFAGWKLAQDVVWEKHNGSGLFADRFRRVHEMALQFYRDDSAWADVFKEPQFTNDATARTVRKKARPAHWIGATGATSYTSEDGGPRLMRSVLHVRSEHGTAQHPTQKPYGIVAPLLAYSCPPGGLVLDPFAGSGTTGLCAKVAGQRAILIEVNAEYAETARWRIADDAPLFGVP